MKHIALIGKVEWRSFKDTKSGYWIAVCDSLKQTVSAKTWAELNETIGQTIDLLFRDLLETDELDSFLDSHGWRLEEKLPQRNRQNVRFDVPWKLVQRRGVYDKEPALC